MARPFGALVSFLLATLACSPRAVEPRVLRLLQVRPEIREDDVGVFLNESLVLHFSQALDPTSVHEGSVQIVAQDGTRARGALRVQDDKLAFLPAPPLARDLSDGGYQPGQQYELRLAGFPQPDGLRARDGAPLEHSVSWRFHTVKVRFDPDGYAQPETDEDAARGGRSTGFVFEDASLDEGRPVVLRTTVLGPSDVIRLEGEEPLDPSTLFAEDFDLRRQQVEEKRADKQRVPLGPRVPLHARLVENHDKHAPQPLGSTWIELSPLEPLRPGKYLLLVNHDQLRLRDFGRHPVWVLGAQRTLLKELEVRGDVGAPASTFRESFLDPGMRSLEPVPGSDGTACWSHSGRVEVHWPAAAGSGEHGAVELAGAESRRDVQATRLDLPEGAECALEGAPGLFVLRAQGKLAIEGRLVRRAPFESGDADPTPPPSTPNLEEYLRAQEPEPPRAFLAGETLSAWLARARAEDAPWTVFVAGGDLDIDGPVRVNGPLLLVAGGRIRLADADLIAAPWLYTLGEGGASVRYQSGRRRDGLDDARPASLVLDLATANQLVEPLVFAVRSGPIPPRGAAARWYSAPRVGASAGAGSYRVRYVGEGSAQGASGERGELVVDNPLLLGECPSLRLQIELVVTPGSEWNPPWVDDVELGWEPAESGRSR